MSWHPAVKHAVRITWVDGGREPRCPPNPKFPDGIDLDLLPGSTPGGSVCKVALPYPAKRCGVYVVECLVCGLRVAITTAGRRDDPRSVALPCKGASRSGISGTAH